MIDTRQELICVWLCEYYGGPAHLIAYNIELERAQRIVTEQRLSEVRIASYRSKLKKLLRHLERGVPARVAHYYGDEPTLSLDQIQAKVDRLIARQHELTHPSQHYRLDLCIPFTRRYFRLNSFHWLSEVGGLL